MYFLMITVKIFPKFFKHKMNFCQIELNLSYNSNSCMYDEYVNDQEIDRLDALKYF